MNLVVNKLWAKTDLNIRRFCYHSQYFCKYIGDMPVLKTNNLGYRNENLMVQNNLLRALRQMLL